MAEDNLPCITTHSRVRARVRARARARARVRVRVRVRACASVRSRPSLIPYLC